MAGLTGLCNQSDQVRGVNGPVLQPETCRNGDELMS